MIYALFPQLQERRRQLAGTLSGGQQQMLAIGRGLAADPELLMLDEPSMGLAPFIVDQIFDSIFKLHRERKLTILLVEQRAAEALEGCDSGYVLETGRIILAGDSKTLMGSPLVRNAYLGTA
jgi:branched-chain amino acid transport system ATP-binding protein